MYKIIACDLDETLLTNDKKITEENIAAIKAATEKGVHFVPTTGRGYWSVRETLKELGLYEKPNEYIISYNGAAITENADEKILSFDGLSHELAENLYSKGLDYDVCTHVYTLDKVYVRNIFDGERKFLNGRMKVEETNEENLAFIADEKIPKCIYTNTDHNYLLQIERDLGDLTDELEVSFSSNRYMEFNKKNVNKGKGLKKLADLLGVDIKDTIAIGDNFNDLTMIEDAGLGVSVANGVDAVKEKASYITDSDNNHSAVAEVINKFIL